MSEYLLGDILQQRRLDVGMTVSEAADLTNIRPRILEIFEASDYENFPTKGYAQGMLSSYSRTLGLNSQEILGLYEKESSFFLQRQEIAKNAEYARKGVSKFGTKKVQSAKPMQRRKTGEIEQAEEEPQSNASSVEDFVADSAEPANNSSLNMRNVRIVSKRSAVAKSVGTRGVAASRRSSKDSLPRTHADSAQGSLAHSLTSDSSLSSSRSTKASDLSTGSLRSTKASDSSLSSSRSAKASDLPLSSSHSTKRSTKASDSSLSSSRSTKVSSRKSSRSSSTSDKKAGSTLSNALDANKEEFSAEKDRAERKKRRNMADEEERERRSALSRQQNFFQMIGSLIVSIFSEKRTRLIAIAAILLVLAVGIAAVFLITTAGNQNAGTISVQGEQQQNDTIDTSSENGARATVTTTNGSPVAVSISVAEGKTSLINVTYDDDKAYSGTAVGAWSRTFQVTESMEATFGNPDDVVVTENGQEVQIQRQEDGTGKLSLVVQALNAAQSG